MQRLARCPPNSSSSHKVTNYPSSRSSIPFVIPKQGRSAFLSLFLPLRCIRSLPVLPLPVLFQHLLSISGYFDFTHSCIPHCSLWKPVPKMDELVCFLAGNLLLGATEGSRAVGVPPNMKAWSTGQKRDWITGTQLLRTCVEIHNTTTWGIVVLYPQQFVGTDNIVAEDYRRKLCTFGHLLMTVTSGGLRIGTSYLSVIGPTYCLCDYRYIKGSAYGSD